MNSNLKRYFQFFLVVLAAGSIYPLIYLRGAYQETILEVFGISLTQLNGIYSALGLAFVVGYFPSGWLADQFSAKKLIFVSLLACGLAGLWFAQIPGYNTVVIIFVIWGIFSVFTFWSSHMKMVKMLAKKEEEGRFFGILDGGRGLVEAVLATVALFIFTRITGGGSGDVSALQGVIYMYSFIMIVVSFLILFFVKEEAAEAGAEKVEEEVKPAGVKLNAETFKKFLGNKYVWLLGGIIFFSYSLVWTMWYQGGFLQSVINIDAVRVAQVMVFAMWMRPVGGTLGGFLGDKFGKSNILAISLVIGAVGLVALAVAPAAFPNFFFEALVVIIHLMIYSIRGLYWSLLGDCKIDGSVLGLSIGFVSLLGYIPDFLAPVISTWLLAGFGDAGGQSAFFIFNAGMGVLGVLLIGMFKWQLKKDGT